MEAPRIVKTKDRKLIGIGINTSLAENKTRELWQTFMPRKKEITNAVNEELFSVQIFQNDFKTEPFTPHTVFEKWAAIAVTDFKNVPKGLDTFTLPGGKYAVFIHKGPVSTFPQTTQKIFGEWLPTSGYVLDQRPHFEIMGANYLGTEHEDSEEEVWIPIK